ncbi:unnamed protein product [Cochlearia groenlandica]
MVKIETVVSAASSLTSFVPEKFGASCYTYVGEMIISIGNPLGYAHSFPTGIISCINRTKGQLQVKGKCERFLQTDCSLNEGSSGWPIVNLEGEVIGINCLNGKENVGVGFAIPIDTVVKVMKGNKW